MLDDALRKLPKGISVFELSVSLVQEPDSCGPNEPQELHIRAENAGGGAYAVLETDRWAIDKEDLDPLRDVIAAMLAHTDEKPCEPS